MIEVELSLAELVPWVAALVLALIAYYIAKSLSIVTSLIPLFGGDISGAVENALVSPAHDLLKTVESKVAKGFSDLVSALGLGIGLSALLGLGIYKALGYLWNHALAPRVKSVMHYLDTQVQGIASDVLGLSKTVEADLVKAEKYATGEVAAATTAIEATLRKEIAVAKRDVESYADSAVSELRKAENAALGSAVSALNAGIAEAERAAHAAETEAEAAAASALTRAEATFNTAIADVRGIAVGAEDDIETLIGKYGLAGAAGLIASIPLLATLVNTIAAESGLDSSECRGKVKNICGTNPQAWERLLGFAGFLTLALDFQDFVNAAEVVAKGIGAGVAELERPFVKQLPPLELAA